MSTPSDALDALEKRLRDTCRVASFVNPPCHKDGIRCLNCSSADALASLRTEKATAERERDEARQDMAGYHADRANIQVAMDAERKANEHARATEARIWREAAFHAKSRSNAYLVSYFERRATQAETTLPNTVSAIHHTCHDESQPPGSCYACQVERRRKAETKGPTT